MVSIYCIRIRALLSTLGYLFLPWYTSSGGARASHFVVPHALDVLMLLDNRINPGSTFIGMEGMPASESLDHLVYR